MCVYWKCSEVNATKNINHFFCPTPISPQSILGAWPARRPPPTRTPQTSRTRSGVHIQSGSNTQNIVIDIATSFHLQQPPHPPLPPNGILESAHFRLHFYCFYYFFYCLCMMAKELVHNGKPFLCGAF